jgi:hypothetical protein
MKKLDRISCVRKALGLDPPKCKDCKWLGKRAHMPPVCNYPHQTEHSRHGSRPPWKWATNMRRPANDPSWFYTEQCGPEGKYWEPK